MDQREFVVDQKMGPYVSPSAPHAEQKDIIGAMRNRKESEKWSREARLIDVGTYPWRRAVRTYF